MTLSTHAVAGASIALAFRNNPAAALIAAFFSHFILDAIPHWHYEILSRKKDISSPFNERIDFDINFLNDLVRTGIDFGIGLFVSLAVSQNFFPGYFWLAAFGAFAGVLPDILQIIYFRFPNSPLFYHQWLHEKVHTRAPLGGENIIGVLQQIILAAIIFLILIY